MASVVDYVIILISRLRQPVGQVHHVLGHSDRLQKHIFKISVLIIKKLDGSLFHARHLQNAIYRVSSSLPQVGLK